jgi:PAS domain-containing protein
MPEKVWRTVHAAVLDAAATLIVVLDADGRLVRWNRACEQLLGYTAAELDGPRAAPATRCTPTSAPPVGRCATCARWSRDIADPRASASRASASRA